MLKPNLARTKIVCTLGPASSDRESIEKLILSGMNVARLNFSHGDHQTHKKNIDTIRELSSLHGVSIAILQDLQGPKIRTGKFKSDYYDLVAGSTVVLTFGLEQVDSRIPIDYRELAQETYAGSKILLDDGLMEMEVERIDNADVVCKVIHGGKLKSRKGVNFPTCDLSIPSITEKDTRDLLFGVSVGVDYVALSFVRKAEDVQKLKQMLKALGSDVPVVAKIEMLSALINLDEICKVSDAVMVARGDLGVECGFAKVASNQKIIVSAARKWGKPVIVATQMLDSMIENPRPTKAEICDVANAVFDLADATMLSGESASGKYPSLAVSTMKDILTRVDHCGKLISTIFERDPDSNIVTETIAETVAFLAGQTNADAIVCLTLTGSIARSISKHRPYAPILALSPRPDVVRKLSLVRGVHGIQNPLFFDTDAALAQLGSLLAKTGLVKENDLVIITGGIPLSRMKPSNTIKLQRISKEHFNF